MAAFNLPGDSEWEAYSAGSKPAGCVHPLAIEVMREVGIDISLNRSKHIDEFADMAFDLAVTVCDTARESCPVLPGATEMVHWPFEDPAHAKGSKEERLGVFRRIRDSIQARIAEYLATVHS